MELSQPGTSESRSLAAKSVDRLVVRGERQPKVDHQGPHGDDSQYSDQRKTLAQVGRFRAEKAQYRGWWMSCERRMGSASRGTCAVASHVFVAGHVFVACEQGMATAVHLSPRRLGGLLNHFGGGTIHDPARDHLVEPWQSPEAQATTPEFLRGAADILCQAPAFHASRPI